MSAEVTREEFLAAYESCKPNKLTNFVYKYFSLSTKPEDLFLKKWVNGVLFGLFGIIFLLVVFDAKGWFVDLFNFSYAGLFFSYVGIRFYAHNQINRIAYKVSEKLNITIDEYIIYYNRYMN
jgi:hypothetical protein